MIASHRLNREVEAVDLGALKVIHDFVVERINFHPAEYHKVEALHAAPHAFRDAP